jgi:hypothetical protein
LFDDVNGERLCVSFPVRMLLVSESLCKSQGLAEFPIINTNSNGR